MKVLDSPRATIIIGSTVLWVGFGVAACSGSGSRPDVGSAEERELPEAGAPNAPGTPRAQDRISPAAPDEDTRRIVFVGTSLTAGYGLEDLDLAYPSRLQGLMREAGLRYVVVNEGVSGDTSAGGLARSRWLLEDSLAVLFIELGANDALRGQSPEALYRNLSAIAAGARSDHPDIGLVVAGMEAPPNLGPEYGDAFRDVFRRVADESRALFIPFLLDGVAAIPELNQPDGIHPNEEGHHLMAARVWERLEPWLRARCSEDGACS